MENAERIQRKIMGSLESGIVVCGAIDGEGPA
jgi:hypothetical protein